MDFGAGVGARACELVAGVVDDFLGEFARGCDCATECDEEKEPCGAFWTVLGVGVCDCVDFGELFAVAVEPVVRVKACAWRLRGFLLQCE